MRELVAVVLACMIGSCWSVTVSQSIEFASVECEVGALAKTIVRVEGLDGESSVKLSVSQHGWWELSSSLPDTVQADALIQAHWILSREPALSSSNRYVWTGA